MVQSVRDRPSENGELGRQRLNARALSVVLGSLLSCCHAGTPAASRPEAGPRALVTLPEASPSSSSTASASRPPTLPGLEGKPVYGYLGKRGVFGTLASSGARWSGAFKFVDSDQTIAIEGTAKPREPDPDVPDDSSSGLTGRKQHTYLECSFSAPDQGGAIEDASCLEEDRALEVDGRWSLGTTDEAFYLRTPSARAVDASSRYSALLATPTPKHDCPPFAELLSFSERAGRGILMYTLDWPCDNHDEREEPPGRARGVPQPPPGYQAYVAESTLEERPRLLWSSAWASLPDRDDLNEVSLNFAVLEFAPGLALYVAAKSDDFQSPVSSGGNSSHKLTVWAVSKDKHGPKLDLPEEASGHAGWCFASSTSNEIWLLDLDGDKISEIVIRITGRGRQDALDKSGQVTCVDSPSTVKFVSYRLNPSTLGWQPMQTPPGLTEQRLQRGTPLSL